MELKREPYSISEAYSQALIEAQTLYPDDGVARHRYAMRAAERAAAPVPGTSIDDSQQMIEQGLVDAFGEDGGGRGRLTLVETFPDHVIAEGPDGKKYRIGYALKNGGGVNFDDPQEVEETDERRSGTLR